MVYGDSGLPNSNTGMSLKLFFDKPIQHVTFPDISRYLQIPPDIFQDTLPE
jgi:hypothetical protein